MFKSTAATVKILLRFTTVAIFAACGGGVDQPVDIVPPAVVPPTLVAGTSQVFDAALNSALAVVPFVILKDQYGIAVANIWITWTPSSGKVESDSSRTDANGRATSGTWTLGTVSGMQTVTARTGTVSVVAMTASVAPGPLVRLVTVSPTITGVVGSNVAIAPSVKAVDAFGNGVPRIQVQFGLFAGAGTLTGRTQTTDDNGIATVGSWQLGLTAGAQSIRADDSRTGATTMIFATALPAAVSQFVIIDGNAQTGKANKRLCTSPTIAVRDPFGNAVAQIPVVFTPSVGSGTVTDGSVVSSAGNGYATVGAWTLSGSATQTLVVTSPSLPGVSATFTASAAPGAAYSVCARFVGDGGTPRQRQAVTTAVQRWQRVITGPAQASPLNEPANRCFAGAPALNETVEDLLVFVQIAVIDGPGNTVARAGPCTVHLPSGLTQMGLLQLDSTDMELLLGQGTLDNMVTHEFGHVLGFGTLWRSSFRNLLGGAGTDDPFFAGASARAEFALLFRSYAGNAVPVENTGDVGTRDSHWRRRVFNNELMQGFSQANMPMSRVTVGSLGDLGYTVDLSKADLFVFPGALRASAVHDGMELLDDVVMNEIWGVDRNGGRSLVRAARNPRNQGRR